MRISSQEQAETRHRILGVAEGFLEEGKWPELTTRKLAEAAGIGAGTLFNYFETKEAIVATLLAKWLEAVEETSGEVEAAGLEERLFASVMRDLRAFKGHKNAVREALVHVLTPLAGSQTIQQLRERKLTEFRRIASESEGLSLSPATGHLVWSVYLGLLSQWVEDSSGRREQMLAVVDSSTHMLAEFIRSSSQTKKEQP